MVFVCRTPALLDAVNTVGRAVSQKATIPALEGILLKEAGYSLFLAGYDLEMGITTAVEAEVSEAGAVVLSVRTFGDMVRRLPGETVTLSVDEKLNVQIKSGSYEASIIGISAEEYPEMPSVSDGVGLMLPQKTLKSMIRQTIFAVGQNDTRPVHKGTLFEICDEELRLVSLDGTRLALRCEPIKSGENMRFVVPRKMLNELLKLLSDEDNNMSLAVGKRHIVMEIGGYMLVSRLLDGEFLAYQRAIPVQVLTTVRVNTRELMDSVERAALVTNERIKSSLNCHFCDGRIELSCTTQMGKTSDVISVVKMDGQEETISFNHHFLLDALKNAESDEVVIQLNGSGQPMKILPPEGSSFLFLVLPVKMRK